MSGYVLEEPVTNNTLNYNLIHYMNIFLVFRLIFFTAVISNWQFIYEAGVKYFKTVKWLLALRTFPWQLLPDSAGMSSRSLQKLPEVWRGPGWGAQNSIHPEPQGWPCCWGQRSRLMHPYNLKCKWEKSRLCFWGPPEQLGGRVPTQRQGGDGAELCCSAQRLCGGRGPPGGHNSAEHDGGGQPRWRLEPRR